MRRFNGSGALPILIWLHFLFNTKATTVPSLEHTTALSPQGPQVNYHPPPVYYDPPVIEASTEASTEPSPQNVTIQRCHAQELSQGGALWTLLFLGVGCVVHMPGSVTWLGHKGLYRLVPEFGIMDAVVLFVLVLKGIFYHRQSVRRSIRASLALRYALGEAENWWLVQGPDAATRITTETFNTALNDQEMNLVALNISQREAFENLDPFLTSLRHFSVSRLIGSTLTTLSLVKACAATGTIRTTVLACSYYFSFFIIDLLTWLCLDPGPPPSKRERESEAYAVARLMIALDPFREEVLRGSSPNHQSYEEYVATYGTRFNFQTWPESGGSWVRLARSTFVILILVAAAIAVLISTFWPVSVPIFLLFDFSSARKGKWTFIWLNSLVWLFWIVAAGALFFLSVFIVSKARRKTLKEVFDIMNQKYVPRNWAGINFFLAAYGMLKVALIVRLYFHHYSGANTRKPGWVDWLG
jgi:hypothetical protein